MRKGVSVKVENLDELNELIVAMNPHNSVITVDEGLTFPQQVVVAKAGADCGYDRISILEYRKLKKSRSIGVGILVCGDVEHLKLICRAWCSVSDKVVVSYQKTDFNGRAVLNDGLDYLKKLVKDGIIDNLMEYIPNNDKPRIQERNKRNQLASTLQMMGCTWSHIQDADEYYSVSQLQAVCDPIMSGSHESTYCRYVDYYKDTNHVLDYSVGGPIVDALVPFLFKSNLRFGKDSFFKAPLAVDPTRIVDSKIDPFIFSKDIIVMNHFSYIRENGLTEKYKGWTAKSFFNQDLFKSVIECHENFDGTQEFVTIPKILWDNKIKVAKV